MSLAASATPASNPDRQDADRNSRNAALTLAFAQPGDTLLYLLLPLHHDAFGVSLAEAGLLLAANRLVRIAGYGWIARLYGRARRAGVLSAGGIGSAARDIRICDRVRRVGAAGRAAAVGPRLRGDERRDAGAGDRRADGSGAAQRHDALDRRRRTGQRAYRGSDRRAVRRAARGVSAACSWRRCSRSRSRAAAARRRGAAGTAAATALRRTVAARHLVVRPGDDARRTVRARPVGARRRCAARLCGAGGRGGAGIALCGGNPACAARRQARRTPRTRDLC